ncbi:RimJ/RimL family protein N-acetyltransferase [Allocatelliglobosispora scoriae]|uniref:RimJ/RimL family protein N-acetyltransferase n=1 Tax=Allocatelliglobosispora scoriae TaxID=643052 RepID=A0A841BNJ9_9ACTN|nr:GNAT family N-acetyltransferase [Allocatelliglobosispora scoriae]MBB5869844.1 RimJ/RimL family protein N-acetyltransferase [Allocatelliglobosispora scoriae]
MLRAADDTDRDLVLGWRNHPQVRGVSLTTHEITPTEHAAWWSAVAADSLRQLLIFEWEGAPAGVVIFDRRREAERGVIWGFYLDIDGLTAREALMPAWIGLERDAIDYAFDVLGAQTLGGETLASNVPVLQLHKRFGFTVTESYPTTINGEATEVLWTSLNVANRKPSRR